jgi:UDP-glucose 4-epimerase
MSKYVVTGGAGFIGSALVRGLLQEGATNVVVIDNLLTGRQENLDEVRPFIEYHAADVCDYAAIAAILRGADVVFHEAAIPSVPRSIQDPVPSHEVNINGTFQVLRAAAAGNVGRVVYAASSSAYGDAEVLPKVETMRPQPKSPYALQKLAGEYYCRFCGLLRPRGGLAEVLQCFRAAPGPVEPLLRRALAIHPRYSRAPPTHYLW